MNGPGLTIGRGVAMEMARMAACDVPGAVRVARRGPGWRAWRAGSAVDIRIRTGRVQVRIHVIARPMQSLMMVASGVHSAVGATLERLLGLELRSIAVAVDAVGG